MLSKETFVVFLANILVLALMILILSVPSCQTWLWHAGLFPHKEFNLADKLEVGLGIGIVFRLPFFLRGLFCQCRKGIAESNALRG